MMPFRLVGGGARLVPALRCFLGAWIYCPLGRWAAVVAWCQLHVPACLVVRFAALSARDQWCPPGISYAWLACVVVGFAAMSTRGRWSLLGARLPCLLGGWMCRQFGWWAAVPAWWLLAWLACLVAGCAALSAGGRGPHGACFAWLAWWLAVRLACNLVVGFAAISTRGRWSLLGARLPCLLGDWMCRQFSWWAAVPA